MQNIGKNLTNHDNNFHKVYQHVTGNFINLNNIKTRKLLLCIG